MIINHNMASLNTYRQLSANNVNSGKSLEKLSSGLRINRAGDDAAGLAISEKMRGQIRGLDQAARNAQDGISLIQTAEGGLNETHSILQRMRELAVQASNDTNTANDRAEIQKEVDQLATEITRISTDTEFNTKKLLNGDMGKTFTTTAVAFDATNVQITGSDITDGTYSLKLVAAGTDTKTVTTQTAVGGGGLDGSEITVAADSLYGKYTIQVSNYNGVANTATYTLTKPDQSVVTVSGASTQGAAVAIGNLTFDFSATADNVTANGTIEFNLTSNGLEVDLQGAKTVDTSAIAAYAGETLNVGGFEFTVRTSHGNADDLYTMNVIDKAVKFQIGANADQNTSLAINTMSAAALGIDALNVTTQSGANAAITTIQTAIDKVSSERSKLGAIQNRLEHTISNLGTSSENLTAAESRIRDVDMAKEMMNFQKNNILSQAAQAMLAQANQQPQGVLQLLR